MSWGSGRSVEQTSRKERRMRTCENCEIRKYYVKMFDVHFGWADCPYECEYAKEREKEEEERSEEVR